MTTVRLPDESDHAPFDRLPNALTPFQDSVGIITPASLHFVSSHGYVPPDIDPQEHRLIAGHAPAIHDRALAAAHSSATC